MSPGKRGGGAGHHPGTAAAKISATLTQLDQTHVQATAPTVWAVAYPPAGHRRHWLFIVAPCFACGGAHAHRGGQDGGLRRAGCGRGSYVVQPRVSVQAQRSAA